MKTTKTEQPVCYGHWWSHAFEGDCVAQGCAIQDICRRETLMRERVKEDAAYLEPDRRICRSGNCD